MSLLTLSSEGRCDPRIYANGICVAIIAGGSAKLIEQFVKQLAEESGQPCDWHYVGGRARVLTTGNTDRVKATIQDMQLHIMIYDERFS